MTPQFRLTEPAIRDIEQIADYITRESGLTQAEQFLTRLDAKFFKIVQFPNLGRQYLILYIPVNQDVDILRVVSGYRDLPALFNNSDN